MYTGHTMAASNRADFLFELELKNPDGTLCDFTGATITIALRLTGHTTPTLSGTNLDGHITVTGLGKADVHFARAEMTVFPAGDLDIGVTVLFPDGMTRQLIAGSVPIVDGVVAA